MIAMQPGEDLIVPVDAYSFTTAKSYASDLSFALRRRYKTRRNRADRTFIITRVS